VCVCVCVCVFVQGGGGGGGFVLFFATKMRVKNAHPALTQQATTPHPTQGTFGKVAQAHASSSV
jgi:hypothetical protein